MIARLTGIAAALAALLIGTCTSSAQEAGLFNSPKGFGAMARWSARNPEVFWAATAYVDIYGVVTSRCSYPGFKFGISRNYSLKTVEADGFRMQFYAGPGLCLGYVRDHDKGRGFDLVSLTADNPGVMAAVSAGAGCRFDFGGRVALDLSLTAEAGVHIRRNEQERQYAAASVSIYNNGLLQALYPQFSILFRL